MDIILKPKTRHMILNETSNNRVTVTNTVM